MSPARAQGRQESPQGKACQGQPQQDPVQSEKTKEAQRSGRNEPTDLGGSDRIEIQILDFRADKRVFAEGAVQLFFQMAAVETGEIDKVQVEAGLGTCGDDQERNQGQRERAVPKQAGDHQHQKEIKTVEELPVVCVLHFPHPAELITPNDDLTRERFGRHTFILPRQPWQGEEQPVFSLQRGPGEKRGQPRQ